jgi:hypothetical protein
MLSLRETKGAALLSRQDVAPRTFEGRGGEAGRADSQIPITGKKSFGFRRWCSSQKTGRASGRDYATGNHDAPLRQTNADKVSIM